MCVATHALIGWWWHKHIYNKYIVPGITDETPDVDKISDIYFFLSVFDWSLFFFFRWIQWCMYCIVKGSIKSLHCKKKWHEHDSFFFWFQRNKKEKKLFIFFFASLTINGNGNGNGFSIHFFF